MRDFIGDSSLVIVYGDVLTDMNLHDLLAFHREVTTRDSAAGVTLSLCHVNNPTEVGLVDMASEQPGASLSWCVQAAGSSTLPSCEPICSTFSMLQPASPKEQTGSSIRLLHRAKGRLRRQRALPGRARSGPGLSRLRQPSRTCRRHLARSGSSDPGESSRDRKLSAGGVWAGPRFGYLCC